MNENMRTTLREFLQAYPSIVNGNKNFLFFETRTNNFHKAIKRGQAWKIINSLCREIGLRGNYGTHSLRKTWGYHARMRGVDLSLIMYKLNHSSIAYTKRYIGITDDELEKVVRQLNL